MICLTFDTDYMRPEDMERFLQEYPIAGASTFFLWNDFAGVSWRQHEVCPHPIFDDENRPAQTLSKFETYVPSRPKGIRAHSCHYSHMMGTELKRRNYLWNSSYSFLYQDNITPMREPWGVWQLPIYYMDNMDFTMNEGWEDINHTPFDQQIIDTAINGDHLYVFDFHPLHVILNTSDRMQYAAVKDQILERTSPYDLAFPGNGTRTYFEKLIDKMAECNMASYTCSEALESFAAKA